MQSKKDYAKGNVKVPHLLPEGSLIKKLNYINHEIVKLVRPNRAGIFFLNKKNTEILRKLEAIKRKILAQLTVHEK